MEIGKSRFSELYKEYQENPEKFSLEYGRKTPNRKLGKEKDIQIITALRKEKQIIEDPKIQEVSEYNFQALSDEIFRESGERISVSTLKRRAKEWKFFTPEKKKKIQYKEFEVGGFGILWQHDASFHKWSPFMEKFYLILSIDDHSRYIIGARFFMEESTMNHLFVMEESILCFGIPLKYYVDRHSIFTGHERNGYSQKQSKSKEEFEVQFVRVCESLLITPVYARSPNAKGKVERIFRYLQDRLCRRMAKGEVRTLEEANKILDEEVEYHNHHRKHSKIKQIPVEKLNQSITNKTSKSRTFDEKILKEKISEDIKSKDIFALEETRKITKYQEISYQGQKIKIPQAREKQTVFLKIRTDETFEHLRIFSQKKKGNGKLFPDKILKEISLPFRKKAKGGKKDG